MTIVRAAHVASIVAALLGLALASYAMTPDAGRRARHCMVGALVSLVAFATLLLLEGPIEEALSPGGSRLFLTAPPVTAVSVVARALDLISASLATIAVSGVAQRPALKVWRVAPLVILATLVVGFMLHIGLELGGVGVGAGRVLGGWTASLRVFRIVVLPSAMNPGEVGRWFSFSLVALAALAAPCSLGCAAAADDESSIETEESEDELRTSSTNVYSCSVFSEYRDQGWDERVYLRVSKTRVTWNTKNDFRKSAGATVMPRDTDYTPPANSPGYTRYESAWIDQEGRVQGSYNWRVTSSMLTGGSSMPGGRVGGYATFGRRIDSDGYASARYLCSRK